jgi:hypothetical protein
MKHFAILVVCIAGLAFAVGGCGGANDAKSRKPHRSWAALQQAVEEQGWSSNEAADFVVQMKKEGLSVKRAQGTVAAAFTLEKSRGDSFREALRSTREAETAIERLGR